MDLGNLYETTRQVAGQMGTIQLKWRAREARRALAANRYEPALQVKALAFDNELTARGMVGDGPSTDAPFHRLA